MAEQKKKVLAVVSDLMFMVKIQDAAKRAGLELAVVKTQAEALKKAAEHPALIILDLNYSEANPVETIAKLKSHDDTRDVPLVGFVSHIQGDLIKAAQEQGCDQVMARSAFSQNLPSILGRYAAADAGSVELETQV